MADPKKKKTKKKVGKVDSNGIVHIKATFNNTIVTIADKNGKTIPIDITCQTLIAADGKLLISNSPIVWRRI